MDAVAEFTGYLKSNGFKRTKERLSLIKLLSGKPGHFDADGLYDMAKGESLETSRASVYRTIALLKKSGLLSESIRKDGKAVYEVSPAKGHHDHLVCLKCGGIEEFKDNVIEEHQEKICRKYGFEIKEHRLEIRGYCRKCR